MATKPANIHSSFCKFTSQVELLGKIFKSVSLNPSQCDIAIKLTKAFWSEGCDIAKLRREVVVDYGERPLELSGKACDKSCE